MKKDLRVVRTQTSLIDAMQSLLEKEHFSTITVNDLCQEAMVGRSTFYDHYDDKYQLLKALLNENIAERKENLHAMTVEERLYHLLETISDKRLVFENILLGKRDYEVIEIFHEAWIDLVVDVSIEELSNDAHKRYNTAFISGGLIVSILEWVRQKDIDIDTFVAYQSEMIHALSKTLSP